MCNDGTNFDLQAKACCEALQAAQKRARLAFFLSLAASCVVALMVFNLIESYRLRNTEFIKNDGGKTEYQKEISKHIADNSFYELPSLGIQITCDDVGIWGPLTLFLISFYAAMAFRACYIHVHCASDKRFAGMYLIQTLLDTQRLWNLPKFQYQIASVLQFCMSFLPFVVCIFVTGYVIYARVFFPAQGDPLSEIIIKNRSIAIIMDIAGGSFTLLVLFQNGLTWKAQTSINKCLSQPKCEVTADSRKAARVSSS